VLCAHQLTLGSGKAPERFVDSVDGADAHQALNAFGVLADGRFEEASSAVRPTSNERDAIFAVLRGAPLQNVVDIVGVALEEALETAEELLDEVLRVPLGVREEHGVGVDDGGKEVRLLAGLPLSGGAHSS
jgi:hypothetical protein